MNFFSVKPAKNFIEGVGVIKRKARKFDAEVRLRRDKFRTAIVSVEKVLEGFK